MIERHYFGNDLIKSFDFTFGFCIPGSSNTWDAVYDVPALDGETIDRMIGQPYLTESDSFYFVDDMLIMHNKASYRYVREDCSESKRSYESKFESKGRDMKDITQAMSQAKCSTSYVEQAETKTGAKEMPEYKWSKETDY